MRGDDRWYFALLSLLGVAALLGAVLWALVT